MLRDRSRGIFDRQRFPQLWSRKDLTTLTLIRVSPKPTRRIVGQLHDIERILDIISNS